MTANIIKVWYYNLLSGGKCITRSHIFFNCGVTQTLTHLQLIVQVSSAEHMQKIEKPLSSSPNYT